LIDIDFLDDEIFVIDLQCLRTLVGHTGGVWSSQMQGNIIVSGSTDRTLKVWNAESGQCLHTLYGHTSTVRCMHLHGNKYVHLILSPTLHSAPFCSILLHSAPLWNIATIPMDLKAQLKANLKADLTVDLIVDLITDLIAGSGPRFGFLD